MQLLNDGHQTNWFSLISLPKEKVKLLHLSEESDFFPYHFILIQDI